MLSIESLFVQPEAGSGGSGRGGVSADALAEVKRLEGGTVELIYNECWGVVALSDGYALSCGAGIEGCELHASGSAMHTDCVAGRGDTRAGAKLLGPGLWNSLAIRTDVDGTLIWQRADQYREAGDPGIDDSTWEATTSASEWVVVLADGALGFINDEANGVAEVSAAA